MTLPYANPYTVGDIVEFDGITWLTDEVKYTVSQRKGWVLIPGYVLDQMGFRLTVLLMHRLGRWLNEKHKGNTYLRPVLHKKLLNYTL